MEKEYVNYRIEGSAALKPEVVSRGNTTIISIEPILDHPRNRNLIEAECKNSIKFRTTSNVLINRISNDPLLGSIPYASKKPIKFTKAEQSIFMKGSIFISLFGLVVILIGA